MSEGVTINLKVTPSLTVGLLFVNKTIATSDEKTSEREYLSADSALKLQMKLVFTASIAVLLSLAVTWTVWSAASGSCPYSPKEETVANPGRTNYGRMPVLVELFTSEGCSSCPPADRQLAFMQQNQIAAGAEIITLAYHVDYWDRLGWKDRFSSAEFSERQNSYTLAKGLESNYTPQMVVDGGTQFVGSNAQKAEAAVSDAAKVVKGTVGISASDGKLNILIDALPQHDSAVVLLAVAEDKLETDVRAGENSGSKLAHTGVVRSLTQIGEVASGDTKLEVSSAIPSNAAWKRANVRYVVFVQEEKSKKILAVSSLLANAN